MMSFVFHLARKFFFRLGPIAARAPCFQGWPLLLITRPLLKALCGLITPLFFSQDLSLQCFSESLSLSQDSSSSVPVATVTMAT